ncbi:Pentatricopeptide repeat-containing protein, partial [Symbiodinium microadriaticum]
MTSGYSCIINAYADAGNEEECQRYLHEMQQRGVTPTTATYSTLIKCSATRGDVKSAEVWFQRIGEAGLVPDTQSYNNVLAARADVPSSACLKWEFPKTE